MKTTKETVSIQELSGTSSVIIDGNTLDPTPFVTLSIDQYRSGDLILGGILNVSLSGKIYSPGGGFAYVSAGAREKIETIGSIGDCIEIQINCGETQLVNGKGVIASVQVDEGPDPTWTQITTYSISVEVHENFGQKAVKHNGKASDWISDSELVKDISESVTMSVDNDALMVDNLLNTTIGRSNVKYDFDMSVTGASIGCKDIVSRKTGIDAAEEVIKRRIETLAAGAISSSLGEASTVDSDLSIYHNGAGKYLQIRNMTADPVSGSLQVSGNLTIRPNYITHNDAFVEINVESSKDISRYGDSVTISGTIEGLDYMGFSSFIQNFTFHSASANKISAAENAWNQIKNQLEAIAMTYLDTGIDPETASCIQGSLLGICEYRLPESDFVCDLREINRSVVRNFGSGTINFTSEWSNEKNCNIQGAAKTTSEVTHTYPTDLFAEFTIPFRGEPLMQDLRTTSAEKVSVSVTVSVPDVACNQVSLGPGCARGEVDTLAEAEGVVIDLWYLTSSTVSYNNTGEVTVSKEWTKNYDCE